VPVFSGPIYAAPAPICAALAVASDLQGDETMDRRQSIDDRTSTTSR
jgi:hypothetical protein